MNTLSKFDGQAVALQTIVTLSKAVAIVGTLKPNEKTVRIVATLLQDEAKKGSTESDWRAYPVTIDVPESMNFKQRLGAIFTRLRSLAPRMPLNRNKAVHLAIDIDGKAVSTTQIEYGGIKGRAFIPAPNKKENESEFLARYNQAFRDSARNLTMQIIECFGLSLDNDETVIQAVSGGMAAFGLIEDKPKEEAKK